MKLGRLFCGNFNPVSHTGIPHAAYVTSCSGENKKGMWSVMQIAAKFQQGFDQLRHDALALFRDINRTFRNMSDETIILLGVFFILSLFYLIVRQPSRVKGSGSMGRQFMFALAVILIFSVGIDWLLENNHVSSKITPI